MEARKATSAGAHAEEVAVARRQARLNREEIRRRDEAVRSAEESAEASQREVAQLRAALEKLTEEDIDRHNLYERVSSNTYKHYREHIRDIKRWLAVNAKNS